MKYNDNGTYEDIVIKAVAPGRNSYSSSQQEVYSCNYVNGIDTKVNNITGTLLWTNQSPSDDFADQTINIDLTNYDIIEIYYRPWKVSSNLISSKCIKGLSGILQASYVYSDTNVHLCSRKIDSITNNGVAFSSGKRLSAINNASTSNSDCIPVYIIGYKTEIIFN